MSRTAVGRDFMSDAAFKTTQPAPANVLALGEGANSIPTQGSNTRTTLGGNTSTEIATDGLGRALATYVHTTGTQTSTLQRTFTNSAGAGLNVHTPTTIGVVSPTAAGTPGAANTGILVFETAMPSPPPLAGTDSVNVTVSIDFGA